MNPLTTEGEQEATLDCGIPLPPRGEDLPCDDGEPLETSRHRIAMNVLIDSLDHHWQNRNDYYVGGNMFVYYSSQQAKNRDFRGPDFFAVLGVDRFPSRKSWVVWEENGHYPDVIIELMSDSTAKIDQNEKKELYQNVFRTANYFVYHPYNQDSLQGWRLEGYHYVPIEKDENGWMWSDALELWVAVWWGTVKREEAYWLRFFTPEGELVLLDSEQAQQEAEARAEEAQQAQQRSRELEETLRRYQQQFGELD